MKSPLARPLAFLVSLATACTGRPSDDPQVAVRRAALSGFNVLTRNYDNQRSGANLGESALKPSNVKTSTFGKVFQVSVDDQVYAGILYASGVSVGGTVHNVFYVATVNNTVYAFDADVGGGPLWQRNFNGSGRPTTRADVGQACGNYQDFSGNIGIIGTPVIDGAAMTLYFVTRTVEAGATVQRLRAIDIATGADRSPGSRVITASVPGTGAGSSGGNVAFNPTLANQRPALGLSAGVVTIGWSSFCDTGSYHGWLIAYDATTLNQVGAINVTPNGSQAGIWMAGAGPLYDASGNLYVSTGNGDFDGSKNFGESLVKVRPPGLGLQDFFTPSNFNDLNGGDTDFGSGGPILLPGTALVATGSKEGKIYLLDSANLGHLGDSHAVQVLQAVDPATRPGDTHHIHNTPVSWMSPQGLNLYVWGENDFLRAYRFNGTRLDSPAALTGSVLPPVGMPGGMMTLSASGSTAGTGVLWATTPKSGDANQSVVPGVMHAFNAETLALLWQSTMLSADDTMTFSKGSPPVVANGRVYVASLSGVVSVYGLRAATVSPNLALNRPATGSPPCASTETPDKAVNGSVSGGNSDKFCSFEPGVFLQVDLGATTTINQFIVRHAAAGGESAATDTRDFNLQVSTDGSSFTTVVTVTGNTADVTTHSFASRSARFVRLNVTTPTQTSDQAARIYELEVYGPVAPPPDAGAPAPDAAPPPPDTAPPPPDAPAPPPDTSVPPSTNLALHRPATGSRPCASTETPDKAVNGSVSGGNSDKFCSFEPGVFLLVDLGTALSVNQFILRHAGAGGETTGFNTRDFNLQVSTDGTNFTTVVTVTGNTADVTTHPIATTTARFVRLNVTAPTQTSDQAARIYELEVYGPGSGSGPPPAPTGLTATAGSDRVMLSWSPTPGATAYNVKRATTSGGPFTTVATRATTLFVDTGAANGTTFFYVVTATGSGGESAPSVQVSATPSTATCVTTSGGASDVGPFVNTAFPQQTGTFTAEYDGTPSAVLDSAIMMSQSAQSVYTGFATLTRFSAAGVIDARNGGGFNANVTLPYSGGNTYHFRVAVNVPAHTYSIFVTPPGGAEQTIGNNFAFRSDQSGVALLANWAVKVNNVGTSLTNRICNFWVHP